MSMPPACYNIILYDDTVQQYNHPKRDDLLYTCYLLFVSKLYDIYVCKDKLTLIITN